MEDKAKQIRKRIDTLRSGGEITDAILTSSPEQEQEVGNEGAEDFSEFNIPHACAHVRTDETEAQQEEDGDLGAEFEPEHDVIAGEEATRTAHSLKYKTVMILGVSLIAIGGYAAWYLSSAVAKERAAEGHTTTYLPSPTGQVQLPVTSAKATVPVAVQQQLSSSGRSVVPAVELQAAMDADNRESKTERVQKPKSPFVAPQKNAQRGPSLIAKVTSPPQVHKAKTQNKTVREVRTSRVVPAGNADMKAAFSPDGWDPAEFTGIGVVSVKNHADTTIVKVPASVLNAAMPLLAAKSLSHYPCGGSHCFVLPNHIIATK